MKSTRSVSVKQEKAIAKAIGGRRTPNSGAGHFKKGDINKIRQEQIINPPNITFLN